MAYTSTALKVVPPLEDTSNDPVAAPSSKICRVLLLEDDAANRMVACELLQLFGYEVDVATNGPEAVTLFMSNAYPIAVFDLMMEGVDGMETTRCIRELERIHGSKPMQILCLTASAQPGQRQECLAAGMNDYLTKPFNVDELRQKLAKLYGAWNEKAA